MKTSQQLQEISAGISLIVLATGFVLMGIMSILHQPANALQIGPTASTIMGGSAGIGTGSIFSFAALIYWRRPVGLAIA